MAGKFGLEARITIGELSRREIATSEIVRRLVERGGHPAITKSDIGAMFLADRIDVWIKDRPVDTNHIDPGGPPGRRATTSRLTASFGTAA